MTTIYYTDNTTASLIFAECKAQARHIISSNRSETLFDQFRNVVKFSTEPNDTVKIEWRHPA